MTRNRWVVFGAVLACAAFVPAVYAQPEIVLCYDYVDIGGGRFEYTFELSVNENWQPGMGWRWFIFGDAQSAPTPLTSFVGDPNSLPIGPWTQYTSSGGGHNGPTLGPVLTFWVPQSGDEKLTWKGTSTAALDQGDLLYSTLAGTQGGATPANFTVATQGCGGGATCQYRIKKVKAKKGCEACPSVGDTFGSEQSCENVKDCDKKIKTRLTCPDGPGFCKIKAKRSDCS